MTESTYGNRLHPNVDYMSVLADTITATAKRGGVTVMPAFAVGRAQMLLHLLVTLRSEGRILNVSIVLDSPMASKATQVLLRFPEEHHLDRAACAALENKVDYIDSVEESKALARRRGPMVIVSASGMATGGRVLHHLKRTLPEPRHQVIFVGYQAPGTRGDTLLRGVPTVKMHGEYIPVRAPVINIDALSAHADQRELLDWLATAPAAPRQVFITHGEPESADALRLRIKDRLGWQGCAPEPMEKVTLR